MAAIAHTHTAAPGFAGCLLAAIQHMQENRARCAIYRQTVRELNVLTDRELADLNLSRASIRDVAREAVYGRR